jgi:hypothetical protein
MTDTTPAAEAKAAPTIFDALAAAQSEFGPVRKNGKANYGKYATLDEILAATRPALNRHGIFLCQKVEAADGGLTVETLLCHKGETLTSGKLFMPITAVKGGNAAQAMGSARTYACRYSLASFLGIAADDDDDGAGAGRRQEAEQALTQELVDSAKHAASCGMQGYTAFWKGLGSDARRALTTSGWHDQLKRMATEADKGAE